MSTDRELLELAAKAIRLECDGESRGELVWFDAERGRMHGSWNPFIDDGDALRLAVELVKRGHLTVLCLSIGQDKSGCEFLFEAGSDIGANTRRAIIRAAAEMGKTMP